MTNKEVDYYRDNGSKFYPVQTIGPMPLYLNNSSIDIVGMKKSGSSTTNCNNYPLTSNGRLYAIVGKKVPIFNWGPNKIFKELDTKPTGDKLYYSVNCYTSYDKQQNGEVDKIVYYEEDKTDTNTIQGWACFGAIADTDDTSYQSYDRAAKNVATNQTENPKKGAETILGGPNHDTIAYIRLSSDSFNETRYRDLTTSTAVWHWHLYGKYTYGYVDEKIRSVYGYEDNEINARQTGQCDGDNSGLLLNLPFCNEQQQIYERRYSLKKC